MRKLLVLAVVVLCVQMAQAQQIWYVSPNGTGSGLGFHWTNASDDLQDVINKASAGDEVWVAEGAYIPNKPSNALSTNPQDNAFVLKKDVQIFGGYNMYFTECDFTKYPTTLDAYPYYHVVISAGNVGTACLDGFTVRRGIACGNSNITVNNEIISQSYGGGIMVCNSSPTLKNLIIKDNIASNGGGIAIYNGSNPTLSNIEIHNNGRNVMNATAYGGGMSIEKNSSPMLNNVIIRNNYSNISGGGLYIANNSSPTLSRVIIRNNEMGSFTFYSYGNGGGGMFIENSSPVLTNVEMCNNTTGVDGGGMYITNNSSPVLSNVMINDNVSYSSSGGIHITDNSNIKIHNVSVTNNSANRGGGICVENSNVDLFNVSITKNTATYGDGGGIYQKSGSCNLVNVLIANNIINIGKGGAAYINSGNCTMTNVTVSGHKGGYAILGNTSGSLTINNSIVYGNDLSVSSNWSQPHFTITYNYSLVEGVGGSNPPQPPFYNLDGTDPNITPKFLNSLGGNYRISRSSDCLGKGDNGLYLQARGISSFTNEKDLAGNPRIYGSKIDMGCYENQGCVPNASGVIFVKKGANGKQNGSSWADAFDDLIVALEEIKGINHSSQKIWVADGTYYPTKTPPTSSPADRAMSFVISIPLYGGFAEDANDAVHTHLGCRDLSYGNKKTILSGNNICYHVVTSPSRHHCSLNGFLITGGRADGMGTTTLIVAGCTTSVSNNHGGGVCVSGGYPVLSNVEIKNNYGEHGGGIALANNYPITSDMWLENVYIENNTAEYNGGGIYNNDNDFPMITMNNVKISNNAAKQDGGGFYSKSVYLPDIYRGYGGYIEISDNTAGENGGGIYMESSLYRNRELDEISIKQNKAGNNGGGLYLKNAGIDITNVAITDNKANNEGGGLYIDNFSEHCTLINSLIANNTANKGSAMYIVNGSNTMFNVTVGGNEDNLSDVQGITKTNGTLDIYNSILYGNITSTPSNPTILTNIENSLVEGETFPSPATNLDGNTNNPKFVDAANGDYRLNYNSPAIDAGNNNYFPSTITTDLLGRPRIYNNIIDMGAFESMGEIILNPNANGVLFVKKGGAGKEDGYNWANAHNELATALKASSKSVPIQEIWVADGVYYPTTTTNRTIFFNLPNNVKCYGGFPANADDINHTTVASRGLSIKDSIFGNTILSGDIGIANYMSNSHHVVVAADNSYIDGFIVEKGDGCTAAFCFPGNGIYVVGNADLRNLLIRNNTGGNGAGMAIMSGCPYLENIYIYENLGGLGGGIYTENADLYAKNLNIFNNSAYKGGGICCSGNNSVPIFENISIHHNYAQYGGGIYNCTHPLFLNTLIYDNIGDSGATIFNATTITLVHTTIAKTIPITASEIVGSKLSHHFYNSLICLEGFNFSPLIWSYYNYTNNSPSCLNIFVNPYAGNFSLNYPIFVCSPVEPPLDMVDLRPCIFPTASDLLQTDIVGNPRPLNGYMPNYGAYECDGDEDGDVNPNFNLNYWNPFHKSIGNKQKPEEILTEESTGWKLKVYPNPTSGQLTIRNEKSEVRNVEIYDIVGRNVGADLRVCPEQQGEHAGSPQQIKIDISHLAAGMYFLKVDGKVFKVIKQ